MVDPKLYYITRPLGHQIHYDLYYILILWFFPVKFRTIALKFKFHIVLEQWYITIYTGKS